MSTLWVYLYNSTSLAVGSLYHKLYAMTEVIVDVTPHRGTNKQLLRHPHCRSIPVCICFVYQCICGNKIFFEFEFEFELVLVLNIPVNSVQRRWKMVSL